MRNYFSLIALLFVAACAHDSEIEKIEKLRISGSETEKPLVTALHDEYKLSHTSAAFDISGGGTDNGITELINGQTDIANASRMISSSEIDKAKAAGIEINQVIIAQDVIAIITHPSVGVEFITIEDLARIYDGTITNWKELGGPDLEIYAIGRKQGSGTRSYMLHRMSLTSVSTRTLEFDTYEDIVNSVTTTRGAIGYVSNGFVKYDNGAINSKFWIMSISLNGMPFTSPLDKEAISYGDYPLMRPLFQYYTNTASPERNAFVEFELSDKGQQMIEKNGYVPLSANQKEINRRKAAGLYSDNQKSEVKKTE